jgi:HlyD family secretion protein
VRVGYQGTKILRIVEEGYLVTEDDVKTNKVLVELDGSDLQKQIVEKEIQYQSAVANLIDAEQNYEIQINQNQSDIKSAEQKVRFARMDLDKFLGDTITAKIIQEVGLDKMLALATTNDVEQTTHADEASASKTSLGPEGASGTNTACPSPPAGLTNKNPRTIAAAVTNCPPPKPELLARKAIPTNAPACKPEPVKVAVIDFSKYAKVDVLGDGEAKQKIRKNDDDLQVAQEELGQAKSTLEGTQRLFDKGFVTKTDLQRDQIAYENSRLKVQTADTASDLFLKYDFLKTAEQSLSTYAEAVREFDKARRVAISKEAQAKAKLKSCQGQHEVQLRQLEDLKEQLGKCTICAKKPGLVVYGGGRDDMFYGGEERIREGASVRERQAIITIPDMSRMAVNVKIHESYIKKIKKGQKSRITVDAFPDKVLAGEVTKVGVLPDSQNRWMNPDLKVYLTQITIDGTYDWVKPGMSSKVEIQVNKVNDCVYVPVQAIAPDGDKQVCFIPHGFKPERRAVEIGEFNDEFIEVKSGLKEGEPVLLQAPDGIEREKVRAKEPPAQDGKKPAPSAPASAPATIQAKKA